VRVDVGELSELVARLVSDSAGPSGAPAWEIEARIAAALDTHERIESLRARLEAQRAELREEISRIRASLVARRGFVEDQTRASAWPVDPERWHTLRLRVQARLAEFAERLAPAGSGTPPSSGWRAVASDLLELFVKERSASLAEMRRHSDYELTQLERRLTRVDESLEEADELLSRVRDVPQLDDGLASHFRQVAGLDRDARSAAHKSAMLDALYRSNEQLQGGPPRR
jgi:DNA repair exonuclease SbcCD ATPase subunit